MIGHDIYDLTKKLFPINRFLMGSGVRQTLSAIKDLIPDLIVYEVPSGTKVFDWEIPKEWIIRSAFIEDETGDRIIDFKNNNLHVMAYSDPINKWMTKEDLTEYIFFDETNPDAIPYVTSYYKHRVGMCVSKSQWDSLADGRYHIYIDSEFIEGSLTYGEAVFNGKTDREIIFHSVVCHPSLANDELSGVTLSTFLAKKIMNMKERYYTYRFIFVPETIGAITYISRNIEHLKENVDAGFILSCEGDNNDYSYLPTVKGNTLADRVAVKVLSTLHPDFKRYSFMQRGSDERQYNAPGVHVPVCLVCRTKAEEFNEYHNSLDNMDFVSPEGFEGSYEVFSNIIELLENNFRYKTLVLCEPQLGKRGLYSTISKKGSKLAYKKYVDVLAYADGNHDLIDISDITKMDYRELIDVISALRTNNLIGAVEL